MLSLLRNNLRLWGYGKPVALFIGCLLFSISSRLGGGVTYEQHLLLAVSDHYYLTFLYMPIILLSSFSFIEDDNEQVILRFNSYHNFFFKKWAGAGLIVLVLIVVQTIAITLSGIGLSSGEAWNISTGTLDEFELFSVFQQFFTSPLQAFGVITVYQTFGNWLVFGLSMWISHFAGGKWTVRILATLYVVAALWLKVPILQELPITGLNHLVILHHNFIGSERFAITGITIIILAALIIATVRFVWRSHLPHFEMHRAGISRYYFRKLMIPRNIAPLISVVSVVMVYKLLRNGASDSGTEWIFNLFSGHGTGYFQVFAFLEMLICNGAPLYLLAAFVEQIVKEQSIFVSIRAGSFGKILRAILFVSAEFIIIYAFFWLTAGLIGTIISSHRLAFEEIQFLIYAVSLKCLDMLVQHLIVLTIFILTKQITFGFLLVVAGNFACIISGKWAAYLPVGLSSLARISSVEPSVGIPGVLAFKIESVFLTILVIFVLLIGRKKVLN